MALIMREHGGERTMTFTSILLQKSYASCHRISSRSHSNFINAFMLLPRSQRRAMEAIYAFMRYVDDLVDERIASTPANIPDITADHRSRIIEFLRWLLVDIYQLALRDSTFESGIAQPEEFPQAAGIGNEISPALIDSIDRFGIPYKCLVAVLDGVEMDLTKNRYRNFAELELYCERVASAVGLACIHIWGFEGRGTPEQENVFEFARKVGIAYQLTNILRDVKEDAAMDRVYLPLDEIAAAGYSVEELKNGSVNPAFENLMRNQVVRAEDYYRAARELHARLKPEGKKIFGLMTATYRAILRRIAARPAAVFTTRIRPGAFERLGLLVKWTCFPPKELLF
jgi:15-cis-phytoene synthase